MRKHLKNSLVAQMLLFGVVILLSLAVIFFVNSELMRRKLRENTLALNEKLLIQTENKIKDYSENLNNIAMVMAYSPTTEQFFEQDSLGRVMVQNSLMEVLSNTMLLNGRRLERPVRHRGGIRPRHCRHYLLQQPPPPLAHPLDARSGGRAARGDQADRAAGAHGFGCRSVPLHERPGHAE